MFNLFKSVMDMDRSPVVICDLNHTIVYMNKSAIVKYHKDLTGMFNAFYDELPLQR